MATYCTAKFAFESVGGRVGGFSESLWHSTNTIAVARTALQTFLLRRMQLSSSTVRVVESNFVTDETAPKQQNFQESIVGTVQSPTDTPWNGVRVYLSTAEGQRRIYRITAVADTFLVGAANNIPASLSELVRTAFLEPGLSIRGVDRTVPPRLLQSVSAAGVYTLAQAPNFSNGNRVRLLRGRDSQGQRLTGDFTVKDIDGDRVGTLDGWPIGRVLANGQLRLLAAPAVHQINSALVAGPIVRKIGRPTLVYSGRQSR